MVVEKLTSAEKFLLEWLSKEESSAYGECHGQPLTVLINMGLAMTHDGRDTNDYSRISLTPAGFEAVRELASTAKP